MLRCERKGLLLGIVQKLGFTFVDIVIVFMFWGQNSVYLKALTRKEVMYKYVNVF